MATVLQEWALSWGCQEWPLPPATVSLSKTSGCFALIICPLVCISTCQSLHHNLEERSVNPQETSTVMENLMKPGAAGQQLDHPLRGFRELGTTPPSGAFYFLLYPAISLSFLSFVTKEHLHLLPVLGHFSDTSQFFGNNHTVPLFSSPLGVWKSTRRRRVKIQHGT